MIPLIFVLAAATITFPDATPLFCRDSSGAFQPVQRGDYGTLKRAFRQQFAFSATLIAGEDAHGRLIFRGGFKGGETISYGVLARDGGVALTEMHVRLRGATEDLVGNDMCWRTFAILDGQ